MVKEFVAMRYIQNEHAAFSVDWYIGKRCNFDCSYCIDYLHDNVSKHPPLEKLIQVVDTIYDRYGNNVHWSITGGEPTIIPWFQDIVEYIYEKPLGVRDISITTNGSRTKEYFAELYPSLHNITMSMHFEHIAHREDEYIEKILYLEDFRKEWNETMAKVDPEFDRPESDPRGYRKKTFLARFMVYPGQFDRIERMYNALKEGGVEKIEFRYIRPLASKGETSFKREDGITDNQGPDYEPINNKSPHVVKIVEHEEEWYSADEKEQLNSWYAGDPKKYLNLYFDNGDEELYHYNQLNFERKNNFEGWTCWAGRTHMKITPSGDIYVGSCHLGGKLGNIFELDSAVLPTGPITCTKWRCTDNLDIRVPKAKPGYEYHVEPYVTKVIESL